MVFTPGGDNSVFVLDVSFIPVSLCYENKKKETARLWKLTAAQAWKHAKACVHGNDERTATRCWLRRGVEDVYAVANLSKTDDFSCRFGLAVFKAKSWT